MFLLLIEVVCVVGRQSGEKEGETNKNMKRKAVLFWCRVTAPGKKNTQVEIQCTGKTDAINNIVQGEGEG